jgi:hypothetical protein
MICLSKFSEAEEAILLGLFAMGTRARVRLFEYGMGFRGSMPSVRTFRPDVMTLPGTYTLMPSLNFLQK